METSGRRPTDCSCEMCKRQCRTPCLATPLEIQNLIETGYEKRLVPVIWGAGVLMGVTDRPIKMIQAKVEDNGWCTFRREDGLCELHDLGLKPTEGRLSHHSFGPDTYNPKINVAWLVAKEWLLIQNFLH